MTEWTFLTKHALVLSLVARQPQITARELAIAVGATERAIRRIIADLDAAGYIQKKRVGRGIRYGINTGLSLRHTTHQHIEIGDFLESLGWKRKQKRRAPSVSPATDGKDADCMAAQGD